MQVAGPAGGAAGRGDPGAAAGGPAAGGRGRRQRRHRLRQNHAGMPTQHSYSQTEETSECARQLLCMPTMPAVKCLQELPLGRHSVEASSQLT